MVKLDISGVLTEAQGTSVETRGDAENQREERDRWYPDMLSCNWHWLMGRSNAARRVLGGRSKHVQTNCTKLHDYFLNSSFLPFRNVRMIWTRRTACQVLYKTKLDVQRISGCKEFRQKHSASALSHELYYYFITKITKIYIAHMPDSKINRKIESEAKLNQRPRSLFARIDIYCKKNKSIFSCNKDAKRTTRW